MAEYAFYIKVDENNEAVNHPIIVDNMKQLFPDHDFSDGSAPCLLYTSDAADE